MEEALGTHDVAGDCGWPRGTAPPPCPVHPGGRPVPLSLSPRTPSCRAAGPLPCPRGLGVHASVRVCVKGDALPLVLPSPRPRFRAPWMEAQAQEVADHTHLRGGSGRLGTPALATGLASPSGHAFRAAAQPCPPLPLLPWGPRPTPPDQRPSLSPSPLLFLATLGLH